MFEVGEMVQVKRFKKCPNHWNPEGKMDKWMGRIVTIKCRRADEYRIMEDAGEGVNGWHWKESDFEKLEGKKMRKSDLKTGWIVTDRAGREYTVYLNVDTEYGGNQDIVCNGDKKIWSHLSKYTDDLINKRGREDLDIVKIEKTYYPYDIQGLDKNRGGRILLWERKPKIKMTKSQIETELGYQIEIID